MFLRGELDSNRHWQRMRRAADNKIHRDKSKYPSLLGLALCSIGITFRVMAGGRIEIREGYTTCKGKNEGKW